MSSVAEILRSLRPVEIDMEQFRAVFRNGAFVPQSTIELAARMKAGNLSADAPRLTREQLQERG